MDDFFSNGGVGSPKVKSFRASAPIGAGWRATWLNFRVIEIAAGQMANQVCPFTSPTF